MLRRIKRNYAGDSENWGHLHDSLGQKEIESHHSENHQQSGYTFVLALHGPSNSLGIYLASFWLSVLLFLACCPSFNIVADSANWNSSRDKIKFPLNLSLLFQSSAIS